METCMLCGGDLREADEGLVTCARCGAVVIEVDVEAERERERAEARRDPRQLGLVLGDEGGE